MKRAFLSANVCGLFLLGRSRGFSSSCSSNAIAAVELAVRSDSVVIFSKSYCPYCIRAKEAFTDLGIPFKAFELDIMNEGPEWQEALLTITGQRTVPNIFVKNQHIGGCDKTLAAIASGEVQRLLKR